MRYAMLFYEYNIVVILYTVVYITVFTQHDTVLSIVTIDDEWQLIMHSSTWSRNIAKYPQFHN